MLLKLTKFLDCMKVPSVYSYKLHGFFFFFFVRSINCLSQTCFLFSWQLKISVPLLIFFLHCSPPHYQPTFSNLQWVVSGVSVVVTTRKQQRIPGHLRWKKWLAVSVNQSGHLANMIICFPYRLLWLGVAMCQVGLTTVDNFQGSTWSQLVINCVGNVNLNRTSKLKGSVLTLN